jgi:hypothetical protein
MSASATLRYVRAGFHPSASSKAERCRSTAASRASPRPGPPGVLCGCSGCPSRLSSSNAWRPSSRSAASIVMRPMRTSASSRAASRQADRTPGKRTAARGTTLYRADGPARNSRVHAAYRLYGSGECGGCGLPLRTAMKEGLPGGTLGVSSRSEHEEARSHVARWIGSESTSARRLPA